MSKIGCMKKSMPLPAYIKNAIRRLNDAGFEAYVVGGAVRSWLLGTEIHDFDITSNALPAEIKEVFSDYRTIDTGIRHGTVTVLDHKNPIEVTTYRTENGYSDHRHPDEVHFTRSLQEDCARRDFTINALCYHPKEGIRDFFGGRQDLQNFLIRAVGEPAVRFDEDALRILRAIRFAAQLGFHIEDVTREAMLEKAETLRFVSQERITSEFTRTIAAPYAKSVLAEYRMIFELLIPELQEYSDSTWNEMCMMMSRCPGDVNLRTAVLLDSLHDVARSDEILRRLKYSNSDRYAVTNYLSVSDMPLSNRVEMRKAMNRLTVPVSSFLYFRCAKDPSLNREELEALCTSIRRSGDCYTLKQLEVTGKDLKEIGLKGSRISMSMNALLNAVMEDKIPNTREDLMRYLRELTGTAQ